MKRTVAILLLAMLSALISVPAQATGPLRVLIVGDSVAHGKVGDYTWRYRLWKEFERHDRPVDFVGPRNDVLDGDAQGYADPDFDSDHAARWGASFEADGGLASGLAETYRPDVLILALGLNDLTWGNKPPGQVQAWMAEYVADVRVHVPDVDVVLARAPQYWFQGVPEFNTLVDALATTTPRTVVSALDEGFIDGVDTYDPAHPSESGERKIANALAASLLSLGLLGPPSAPLESVVQPTAAPPAPVQTESNHAGKAEPPVIGKPSRLKVRKVGKGKAKGKRLRLTWARATNAKRYKIRLRGPRKVTRITKSRRWTSPRLRPGRYVIVVRAVHGKGSVRKVARVR